ncbi:MAG: hypothetical protein N4A36_00415 [Candidatus Gracilibacteria bacterium]|jgi:hypothetical protein|nr:hypothetical protein [Candidatus Gracilibacteria bacterium]
MLFGDKKKKQKKRHDLVNDLAAINLIAGSMESSNNPQIRQNARLIIEQVKKVGDKLK